MIELWLIAMRFVNLIQRLIQHRLNVIFALWLLKLYDNFPLHFTRRCAIIYTILFSTRMTNLFDKKRKHSFNANAMHDHNKKKLLFGFCA